MFSQGDGSKILIVEDESEISSFIDAFLSKRGYVCEVIDSGLKALEKITNGKYDLILLDWMLPGLSGLEILRQIRAQKILTATIFVTAKAQPDDIVEALNSGADDYLVKPFDNSILLARIQSVLRRTNMDFAKITSTAVISYGDLSINSDGYEFSISGRPIHLTKYEFKILFELMKNQEKVLTREQLVSATQGDGVSVTLRTIDTHVFSLRKKMDDHAEWIESIRGVGYRLNKPKLK